MEKTELVIQFAHIFNLIAVNLFRLTRLRIFVRHQACIIIDLRFAVGHDCFAIGSFNCLVRGATGYGEQCCCGKNRGDQNMFLHGVLPAFQSFSVIYPLTVG